MVEFLLLTETKLLGLALVALVTVAGIAIYMTVISPRRRRRMAEELRCERLKRRYNIGGGGTSS